jgi:hypothetical protein
MDPDPSNFAIDLQDANKKWIRIREAQKHVDPDPEHCFGRTMLVVWFFHKFFFMVPTERFGFVQIDTEGYCCAGGGGREA